MARQVRHDPFVKPLQIDGTVVEEIVKLTQTEFDQIGGVRLFVRCNWQCPK